MKTKETVKELRIIQCSRMRTASTVLTNILHGLMCPNEPVNISIRNTNNFIIKTHDINIDKWNAYLGKEYDLFFIASERPELNKTIDTKYYSRKNVLRFDFNELNTSEFYTVEDMVNNAYHKIKNFLPYFKGKLTKEKAMNRINNMNKLYEKIKHKPFSYYDKFYHLHGSHRNRKTLN